VWGNQKLSEAPGVPILLCPLPVYCLLFSPYPSMASSKIHTSFEKLSSPHSYFLIPQRGLANAQVAEAQAALRALEVQAEGHQPPLRPFIPATAPLIFLLLRDKSQVERHRDREKESAGAQMGAQTTWSGGRRGKCALDNGAGQEDKWRGTPGRGGILSHWPCTRSGHLRVSGRGRREERGTARPASSLAPRRPRLPTPQVQPLRVAACGLWRGPERPPHGREPALRLVKGVGAY
jgi:hypothetical protein